MPQKVEDSEISVSILDDGDETKPLSRKCQHDDDSSEGTPIMDDYNSRSRERSLIFRQFFRALGSFFLLAVLLVCLILIGATLEKRAYDLAPSTHTLYNSSDVCGMNTDSFSTFPIAHEAHVDGYKVAHCGSCGQCSNLHDIDIQAATTETLTADSTKCAFLIFTGGLGAVHKCMQERVGFTPACEDCWVDDIVCNVKHCKFTCIKSKYLFRDMTDNNEEDGELNDCLECDEKMCGPQFLKCSGSNRRRLGIVSDIDRDAYEECNEVDVDWQGFGR